MKAHLPSPTPSNQNRESPAVPQPLSSPPQPPVRRWGRRWLLIALAIAVIGTGAGIWCWRSRQQDPEPPLPPGIVDPEVKAVVEKSREKVLHEPRSADAWGQYGMVLLGNLIDREADQCFARAAELNTADPRWPYARALIALKRRPDEAPTLLQQTIDAAGADREFRALASITLGEALLERRRVDTAAELFRAQLGTGGVGEARATFGLGLVATSRGDDAEAERLFSKVQNVIYCRKQAAAQLAALARARGDVEAARKYEQRVNELTDDPPWPDPILDLAVELQAGSRGRDRRIERLEREGDYAAAIREYEVQLQTERTPKALTGAAVNFARMGNYSEALDLLEEAVKIDPNHVQTRYTMALVLFTRAEKLWHDNPGVPPAKEDFRRVIEEARRTTELKPDYAEAYLFWGLALRFLDQPTDAIRPLRQGLVTRPDDFMLNLSLGQVLAMAGDRAGAKAYLEIAKKVRPDDPRPTQELENLKGK